MTNKIKNPEDLLSNPSFTRWVEGEADRDEALYWDEWSRKSEYNRNLVSNAQSRLLGISVPPPVPGSESQWSRLLESINSRNRPLFPVKRGKSLVLWLYRAAAVILIISLAGYFAYNTGLENQKDAVQAETVWQHVETDYAEHKTIKLTDGSSIILGSHSTLEYPEGWILDNSIEVRLNGEAYFQIEKKEENDPVFRVSTSDGMAEVLGTRFVVDTDENRTRIVLEEGAVNVSEKENEEKVQLKPNEMAVFSRYNPGMNVQVVNPDVYTSWRNEVMKLDNTSFQLVADRIKKTFGIEVQVNDPDLYNRRLTGTLNLRSAERLISAVSEVMEIEVQRIDDTIVFGSI